MGTAYRKTRHPCVMWRGSVLYVTYRSEALDARGRRKKKMVRFGAGTPAQAAEYQRRLQKEADAVLAGEVSRSEIAAKRASTRAIDLVIDAYEEHLTKLGRSRKHIHDTERRLRAWARACRVGTINDADADAAAAWLDGMERAGKSAATINAYRVAVLALTAWAADRGYSQRNRVSSRLIRRRNPRDNRVRVSQVMAPGQVRALLTCEAIPLRRRCYYALAVLTGVRWREIARLRWEHIDLLHSTLTMPGTITKNKKPAMLPIAAPAVEMLSALRRDRGARRLASDGRAVGGTPAHGVWKRDLARAGIIGDEASGWEGYTDERGYVFERKCLRHTFQVMMRRSGVSMEDRRELMRHAGFDLLETSYHEPRMADLQGVVDGVVATILQPQSVCPCPPGAKYPNKGGGAGPVRMAGA